MGGEISINALPQAGTKPLEMAMTEFDFEEGKFGTKATIKAEWQGSMLDLLREGNVREIELNIGKGWKGKNIEFLGDLPQLRSLIIIDQTLERIEPIHLLTELVALHLTTYSVSPVDFTAFPNLKSCWFEWIKGSDSLFDSSGLIKLGLNNYKGRSSTPFSRLSNLRELSLLNSSVEDLEGVFRLSYLRMLRIARLRKVSSLRGIANLENLKVLEIDQCKEIRSITDSFSLGNLKALFLLNTGDIETLRGVEKLTKLEQLVFDESTNILDGDLSPIFELPALKNISFRNRGHYSHRREDFGELYFSPPAS